jgi:hypothetical protein
MISSSFMVSAVGSSALGPAGMVGLAVGGWVVKRILEKRASKSV